MKFGVLTAIIFSWITIIPFHAYSQKLNKYGLQVIKNKNEFIKTVSIDSNKSMMDVRLVPGIILELLYSTGYNFMHKRLYPQTRTTFLRRPAIAALQKIQEDLALQGLGLKIWDAYRPYSVTEKMWEPIRDERYVANPASGSGHNRGISVDVTLVNIGTGQELNMGTGFDNFSDTAHHNYNGLDIEVLKNREILRSVMVKYGFIILETEWWHYYLPGSKNYELLDLSFRTLQKITQQK